MKQKGNHHREGQPRSQGLSSSCPRDVKRRDPGNEVLKSKKKNSRFTNQRSKYFNFQAHNLVLLTTIGMM